MKALRRTILATALALVGVVAYVAPAGAQAQVITAPERSTMTTAEMEAIIRARRDSARMRYTDADVRFMNMMIHHHAQALVMASMAATHGASPTLQTLAGRIISSQEGEIATMQQWLRDRRLPAPEVHISGTTVMLHTGEMGAEHGSERGGHHGSQPGGHQGGHSEARHGPDHAAHHAEHHGSQHAGGHEAHMPGMLTQEQLNQLDRARGAEFERLFLTFMIEHHRGAVTMVHELFATDGAGQDEEVFKFASDVQVDQTTEVARMELMLSQMSPNGRAP